MLSTILSFCLGVMLHDIVQIVKFKRENPGVKLSDRQKKMIRGFVLVAFATLWFIWR